MAIHKLRALEYLLAVVEHGGFAPAARRLGVAAPSVHRLVKALEAELGTVLIDRDSQPLRATPEGTAYVARARELLVGLQQLDASLRDRQASPTGTVVLAAQSVVAEFVLPRVLPRFHEQFPGVRIDLRDPGPLRDLSQTGADALLQFGWAPPQDAALRVLAHTRWLVVAAPAFWERHGWPRHPGDLAGLPAVKFRTPYGQTLNRWAFERAGERVEVEIDGWLEGDQRQALDAPVMAGQLMARVNDFTARELLVSGRVVPVLLEWEAQNSPPLSLLIRRSLTRQPRVRALVDGLTAWAEAEAAQRLPAGLGPVRPAKRPDWFTRRAG